MSISWHMTPSPSPSVRVGMAQASKLSFAGLPGTPSVEAADLRPRMLEHLANAAGQDNAINVNASNTVQGSLAVEHHPEALARV